MKPRSHARAHLSLPYQPPYQWEALLAFLRKRAVAGVEEVSDRTYRRTFALDEETGIVEVSLGAEAAHALSVSVERIGRQRLPAVEARVRRMFDLDADPPPIARRLKSDPRLAPIVRAAPGLRIPATWDPFEAAVRAVLGQQVSLAGSITLVGRLTALCGGHIEASGALTRVFPSPARILRVDLSRLGVPAARARTLAALSRAALLGRPALDGSAPPDSLARDLLAIDGIGPWSARYVALRGLGDPDAFPDSDLGIRKAMDALGYPSGRKEREQAIGRLAPWRGYAAVYLWSTLQ